MSANRLSRRGVLGLSLAALLGARVAEARGRLPVGGRLHLHVPWPVLALDPHRLEDATAAIFGESLFDSLYARDETGASTASLAEAEPEPDGANLRVRVRAGLRTAKGRPFEARDAAAALARSRALGGRAWLADIPAPKVDGRALVFAMRDASRLVHALASPITAMLPSTFTPEAPDGTGPFKFAARGDAMVLSRNALAARGPALLEEVVVSTATDLAASLRAFESGTDDIGWLGSGLHEPRAGSRPYDLGPVGWAVLFTGKDAQAWDAAGVAQRLCDGIPATRISYLHIGPAYPTEAEQGWGGPDAQLFVRDDAPWLVEMAKVIAATITRPGHEVVAKPIANAELATRRAAKNFSLLLDVVRPLGPGSFAAQVALATADNAPRATELVLHPPKLGEIPVRTVTRTLHCGVVGELRVLGGRAGEVQLAPSVQGSGWDLAATTRSRAR